MTLSDAKNKKNNLPTPTLEPLPLKAFYNYRRKISGFTKTCEHQVARGIVLLVVGTRRTCCTEPMVVPDANIRGGGVDDSPEMRKVLL